MDTKSIEEVPILDEHYDVTLTEALMEVIDLDVYREVRDAPTNS